MGIRREARRHAPCFEAIAMLRSPPASSPFIRDGASYRDGNIALAARAGVHDGDRIADVGCGVCGTSIDIALEHPFVSVDAVTTSSLEATHARALVRASALADRIQVHLRERAELPLATGAYDVVLFCEPITPTFGWVKLLAETKRVLRPGGRFHLRASPPMLSDMTPAEVHDLVEATGLVQVERALIASEPRARVASPRPGRGFRSAVRAPYVVLEIRAINPGPEASGERLKVELTGR